MELTVVLSALKVMVGNATSVVRFSGEHYNGDPWRFAVVPKVRLGGLTKTKRKLRIVVSV
jgi:hypothetical protein